MPEKIRHSSVMSSPSFSDLTKPLKPQRYPTCCPIISLSKKTASAFSLLAISSMISRFCELIFMPIIFFGIALRILDFIKLLLKSYYLYYTPISYFLQEQIYRIFTLICPDFMCERKKIAPISRSDDFI